MKPKFHFLLSAAETNTPTAAGAVVEAPAAEAPAQAEAPVPAQSTEAKPSFLQSVLASVQDKGKLAADLQLATQRAETAEAHLTTLQSEIITLRAEKQTLIDERTQIQTALSNAVANQKDAAAQAVEIVAELGFSTKAAEILPGQQEPQKSPIEQLEKQYAAETDLEKKHTIAMQIKQAMAADQ